MVSPAGPTAIGFDNRTVVFFDPATGQPTVHLKTTAGHEHGLTLAPDGKTLAILHPDGKVGTLVGAGREGTALLPDATQRQPDPGRLIFTPDGATLLMARPDGISLDVVTGKELPAIPHRNAQTMHILPDNDTLLVCANDGLVHRWSLKTGKAFPRPAGATRTGDPRNVLSRWPAARDREFVRTHRHMGYDDRQAPAGVLGEVGKRITKLSFSPDGKVIAVGRATGVVEVLDASTGKAASQVSDDQSPAGGPAIRQHDPVYTGWEVITRHELARTAGGLGPVERQIVVDGPRSSGVRDHSGWPDTGFVALRSKHCDHGPGNGAERLRSKLPANLAEGVGGQRPSLAFSPDGRRLFVATRDNHLRVCDPLTANERVAFVASESKKTVFGTLDTAVEAMAFSSGGRWLVTGSEDRTVRVWEVESRKEVVPFHGHEWDVATVAFGPGSRTVLSAGEQDGAVYQWDIRPPAGLAVRSPWDDLAEDAGVAYRAIWASADDSKEAVPLLRSKLVPVAAPKPDEVAWLIGQLNSETFAVRETASRKLAEFGAAAGPALKEALAKEARGGKSERLQKLLQRLDADLSPVDLRAVRAVQALGAGRRPKRAEIS